MLKIKYVPSEETQTMIYDMDLSVEASWRVIGVYTEKRGVLRPLNYTYIENGDEKSRLLEEIGKKSDDGNQTNADIEEVIKLQVKLDFSMPEIVSRVSLDSVNIQPQPEMVALENRYVFRNNSQSVDDLA